MEIIGNVVASPISLCLLWWPPTGPSMFMVVVMFLMYSVLHCLYSVGNKITTTTTVMAVTNTTVQTITLTLLVCIFYQNTTHFTIITAIMWLWLWIYQRQLRRNCCFTVPLAAGLHRYSISFELGVSDRFRHIFTYPTRLFTVPVTSGRMPIRLSKVTTRIRQCR